MKAVIYARYSSDSQREESIEGQLRECAAFAEKNGITVLRHYIDRAYSAKTDNRPEFQNMIKDSGKRLFDIVIVWKLDRFARNRYDSARYKAQLKKNGVKVVSATEVISEGAEGIILESVLEGYAEYYSADLSEKVIRGMTDNALKCKFNGGMMPIGYVIDAEQHFQIDPLTAPFVLEAFKRYDGGETISSIMNWLNEQGLTNTRGRKMTFNSVGHILHNRRYIGEFRYRDVIVPDGIPAIVPQDLFDRVQEKLSKNKKAPARHKAEDDYLLTTKLFCGYCGAYLCGESGTSRTGKVHHYYKCVSVKKKRTECHKKPVRKEWIEDLVVSETMKMVMDDKAIEAIVSMLMDLQDRDNVNVPLYEQQLREADTAISNLLNAIQQGVLTRSTKERLEELENRRDELENRLACEKLAKPKVSAEFMTFWLHRFRKLDVRQQSHRKMLIDAFINAIFLYDDKMVITFNYKEGTKTITFAELQEAISNKNGSDLDCLVAPRQNSTIRSSAAAGGVRSTDGAVFPFPARPAALGSCGMALDFAFAVGRTRAVVNGAPGALQSREAVCAAAQIDPRHRHHVVASCVSLAAIFYALQKKRLALAPLLLLSGSNPLRWALIRGHRFFDKLRRADTSCACPPVWILKFRLRLGENGAHVGHFFAEGERDGLAVVGEPVGLAALTLAQQIGEQESGRCALGDKDELLHALRLESADTAEFARENGNVLVNGDGQHAALLLGRVGNVPAVLGGHAVEGGGCAALRLRLLGHGGLDGLDRLLLRGKGADRGFFRLILFHVHAGGVILDPTGRQQIGGIRLHLCAGCRDCAFVAAAAVAYACARSVNTVFNAAPHLQLRSARNSDVAAISSSSAADARAAAVACGIDLAAGDGDVIAVALEAAAYACAVGAALCGQLAVLVLVRDGQTAAVVLFKTGMMVAALERAVAVQLDADAALAGGGNGGLARTAHVDVCAGEGDVCGLILLRVDGEGVFRGASRNDGGAVRNIDLRPLRDRLPAAPGVYGDVAVADVPLRRQRRHGQTGEKQQRKER